MRFISRGLIELACLQKKSTTKSATDRICLGNDIVFDVAEGGYVLELGIERTTGQWYGKRIRDSVA